MTAVLARAWAPPSPRRVRAVRDRLRLVYGIPLARAHGQPIAELVLTVLSQSTTDRNRDVAYLGLRERFGTWEQVRDAPVDELEAAIRPGGISKVKSARIKAILQAIGELAPPGAAEGPEGHEPGRACARPESHEPARAGVRPEVGPRGELSLRWLAALSVADAQRSLCALPGVGRKTAACVLLFALGMRDVPVDTHVSRVATRLGLLRPGAPLPELHDAMLALTPAGRELELHLNLLRHGRRTCRARAPRCGACALARMCPSAFAVP